MTGLLIGTALALVSVLGLVTAPRLAAAHGGALAGNGRLRQVQTGGGADEATDESETADPTWASFMRAL